MVKKEDESSEDYVPLEKLLRIADLARYEDKLRNVLKLRHAGDLQYVDESDLNGIGCMRVLVYSGRFKNRPVFLFNDLQGMSRPEQKRLRKEFDRIFPKSGLVGKLKKVFVRSDNVDRKELLGRDDGDQHIIPLERITLCKELGKGEFGAVFQASWNNGPSVSDTMQVAVKCVPSDKLFSCTSSFLSEAAIMTKMRHEHVVRLYGVVLDTKKVMLVSELAMCGSMLECLHKAALRDSFSVDVLCDYAGQIAQGMAYLETQRLIHRDLAARNVLVFGPKKVKISDFGLSRSLGVGEDYYRSEFSPNLRLPIAWCSPESINFLKFTSSSDVWSFGVTLWEMFTYGQMPWNGFNGAQILEAVDRQKKHLDRPSSCPDDMWDLMRECWTHNPDSRPSFKHIVDTFHDRLPQTVRTIRECSDAAFDHLQFKKDELVTVLCRRPEAYPDGFYWMGSLKNGKTGLFRPADTVAHLGAELPSGFKGITTGCVPGQIAVNGKEKDKKKDWKESDRDRKKLMISEPQGDFRHTCHVGIDGTAFGLLQIDKKDMTKGAPPIPSSSVLSPGSRRSVTPSMTSSSVEHSSSSPGTSLIGSPASVSRREGSERVHFRDQTTAFSPPATRAPSQPMLPARVSGRVSTTSSSLVSHHSIVAGGAGPVGHSERRSAEPSAPPLSNPNSISRIEAAQITEMLDESLNALNGSIGSLESTMRRSTTSESDEFLQPKRSPNQPPPVSAVYARMPHNSSVHPSTSDNILMDEVVHLERDLTDFSLSTMSGGGDYSDTRPLIDGDLRSQLSPSRLAEDVKRRSGSENMHSCSSSPPTVRMMSDEEMARWREKQEKQHAKVGKELVQDRKREAETHPNFTEDRNLVNKGSTPGGPDWSPEAQQAYRLLVECGDQLRIQHSPEPPQASPSSSKPPKSPSSSYTRPMARPPTPPGPGANFAHVKATIATKQNGTTFVARPALPPKSYVNAEVITPPELPPKKSSVLKMPTLDPSGYDNVNGIGTAAERLDSVPVTVNGTVSGTKVPPPVPPKPKARTSLSNGCVTLEKDEYNRGFTSAVAKSSLFHSAKQEEVIKF